MKRCRCDRGMATLFALALLTGLMIVIAATAAMAQWAIARSNVALVADLAAVAAARQGACDAADRTARAHSVELLECSWQGTDVTVRIGTHAVGIEGRVARWLGSGVIGAQARAGY